MLGSSRWSVPSYFERFSLIPTNRNTWRLEVEVRIRHVKHLDAEVDDSLPQRFDVVGLQF